MGFGHTHTHRFVFVKSFRRRVYNKMSDPCALDFASTQRQEISQDLITVSLTHSLCSDLLGNAFPRDMQQQSKVKNERLN